MQPNQRGKRNPSNERITPSSPTLTTQQQTNDAAQVKQRRAKSQPQMYARQQVAAKTNQGPETQPATPRRRKSGQLSTPSSPNANQKGKPTGSPIVQLSAAPVTTQPKPAITKTTSTDETRSQKSPHVNPWSKNRSAPTSSPNSAPHSRPGGLASSSDSVDYLSPLSKSLGAKKNADTSSDTDSEIEEDLFKRSQSAPRSRIPAETPARQLRSTSVERPNVVGATDTKYYEHHLRNRNLQVQHALSPPHRGLSPSPEFSPPESPDPARGRRSNSCGVPSSTTTQPRMGRGKDVTNSKYAPFGSFFARPSTDIISSSFSPSLFHRAFRKQSTDALLRPPPQRTSNVETKTEKTSRIMVRDREVLSAFETCY